MKNSRRIISLVLALTMVFGLAIYAGAATTFTDVSGHWAWTGGQIPYLVEKGVLNGYKQSNGTYTFVPDGNVTRAEFIKMLDETFGLTATTTISYSDVQSSDWYYVYFQKAAAQGYILNYGTYASPNDKLTREEAISLLVRYLDLPADEMAETSYFSDYSSISQNYREYILRAVYAGITDGYLNNGVRTFKPAGTLTRAEALTILYRAAGWICNQSAYSRDGSAADTNAVVTKDDVTLSAVSLTGRVIISEGVGDGTVALYKSTSADTIYVRANSQLTLDSSKAKNIVVSGGGRVSLLNGSSVETITFTGTSNAKAYIGNGTSVSNIVVENGCENVAVSGDGAISYASINAKNFTSTIVPAKFDIGTNLTATFAGTPYTGSSETQEAFTMNPFATEDSDYSYINAVPGVSGELYYYYTTSSSTPTTSAYISLWEESNYAGKDDVKNGDEVTIKTFETSKVESYDYVCVQIVRDGNKYTPVTFPNKSAEGTGFNVDPYLSSDEQISLKVNASGTVYYFYADSGEQLTQLEFLSRYDKKESVLKSNSAANSLQLYKLSLNSKYTEQYQYVAFMYMGGDGLYYTPVIVALGDNGFTTVPEVSVPGTVSFKTRTAGTLYYYYSENADLPTSDNFSTYYNKAEYGDKLTVTKGASGTVSYKESRTEEYPYLIMAIKTSSGEYLQAVAVDINISDGFESEPELKNENEIRFVTSSSGTVEYYYSKVGNAVTSAQFTTAYEDSASKYCGSVKAKANQYTTIEYSKNYASSYEYMILMFTDEDGKQYYPVVVELDALSDTGFTSAPTYRDGKITVKADADGEVWYFYAKVEYDVSSSDFYDEWKEAKYTGSISVSKNTETTIDVNADIIDKYPYIILAFIEEDDVDEKEWDEFEYPYILDLDESEMETGGSGISIDARDDYIYIDSTYEGTIYWYFTDDEDDLPTSETGTAFKRAYDNMSSKYKDSEDVDADGYIKIELDDYSYVVVCLKNESGTYGSYLVYDIDKGSEYGSDDDFDDGHTTNEYGFSFGTIVYSLNSIYASFTAKADGYVTLYAENNGVFDEVGSIAVEKGEQAYIEIPSKGSNFDSIISEAFNGIEYYLQLETNDDIYRLFKISDND